MVEHTTSVLVVDDEHTLCNFLSEGLIELGHLCSAAADANKALAKLAAQQFDVVLLDIMLPGMSGMKLLEEIRLNWDYVTNIMITGVNDVDIAVEAMKLGASDYIVKPFTLDRVDNSIRTALDNKQGSKKPMTEMEGIALGVEVDLDPLSAYTKVVIQRTVQLARQLDIDEEQIRNWVEARGRQEVEKHWKVNSLREKLKCSALAQYVLGLTTPHVHTPKPDELLN